MAKEKHPIHLVAKKAGQLNKVMLAIMKEERRLCWRRCGVVRFSSICDFHHSYGSRMHGMPNRE